MPSWVWRRPPPPWRKPPWIGTLSAVPPFNPTAITANLVEPLTFEFPAWATPPEPPQDRPINRDGYLNCILAEGPVALWRLDEDVGAGTIDDYIGTIDLTPGASGVTLGGTPGVFNDQGHSVNFLGTSSTSILDTATNPGLGGGASERTAEAWVRTSQTARRFFFSYGSRVATGNWFSIGIDGAGVGEITVSAHNIDRNFGSGFNDGRWHHVVVTYDGTNLRAYVDGVQAGGASATTLSTDISGTGKGVSIGTHNDGATAGLIGDVDSVAFYPYVLPLARIQDHYNCGKYDPAKVAGNWGEAPLPSWSSWAYEEVGGDYPAPPGAPPVFDPAIAIGIWHEQGWEWTALWTEPGDSEEGLVPTIPFWIATHAPFLAESPQDWSNGWTEPGGSVEGLVPTVPPFDPAPAIGIWHDQSTDWSNSWTEPGNSVEGPVPTIPFWIATHTPFLAESPQDWRDPWTDPGGSVEGLVPGVPFAVSLNAPFLAESPQDWRAPWADPGGSVEGLTSWIASFAPFLAESPQDWRAPWTSEGEAVDYPAPPVVPFAVSLFAPFLTGPDPAWSDERAPVDGAGHVLILISAPFDPAPFAGAWQPDTNEVLRWGFDAVDGSFNVLNPPAPFDPAPLAGAWQPDTNAVLSWSFDAVDGSFNVLNPPAAAPFDPALLVHIQEHPFVFADFWRQEPEGSSGPLADWLFLNWGGCPPSGGGGSVFFDVETGAPFLYLGGVFIARAD